MAANLQRLATRTSSLARSQPLLRPQTASIRPFLASQRFFNVSAARQEPPTDNPSHASMDHDMIVEYPEIHERDEIHGLGHSTTGPGVGRHSDRTLGTLSMSGKVCLVTGAARGLGNLFARTFVESGCNQIVIVDLGKEHAEEAAKELTDWFVEHGEAEEGEIEALGLGCDVSNEQEVIKVFETVKERFGRIDNVVNSAGICENIPALDYSADKLHKLLKINLDGSFYVAREAAKLMIDTKTEGSVTLVGSMSGSIINVPQPQTPYNMSKAAVKHMAASLAVEWAKHGITVNCLSPGYMQTSLTRIILDKNPQLRETWENLSPMGRLGEPEDLKTSIIYLASPGSKFTTGIDLRVDGGYCLT